MPDAKQKTLTLVASRKKDRRASFVPKLALLPAARNRPVCVSPDTSVQRAKTLMLRHDYSQLPVTTGERSVRGIVSWKSIGQHSVRTNRGITVADFLEPSVAVLDSSTPLMDAIEEVIKHEVVLVRDHRKGDHRNRHRRRS